MSRFPETVEELIRAIGEPCQIVDHYDRSKVLYERYLYGHHNGVDKDHWEFTKAQAATLTRLAELAPHAQVGSDLYTVYFKCSWWTLGKDGRLSRKISRKEYLDLEQCH